MFLFVGTLHKMENNEHILLEKYGYFMQLVKHCGVPSHIGNHIQFKLDRLVMAASLFQKRSDQTPYTKEVCGNWQWTLQGAKKHFIAKVAQELEPAMSQME